MSKLSLDNIMRVSVLSTLKGLSDINTSALALFTDEIPVIANYGTSRVYLEPLSVATDFGSTSATYRMANMVFSQNPNILTGKGFLVIIPQLQSASAVAATIAGSKNVDFTALTATDYFIRAEVNGGAQADIVIGTITSTSISTILTSLNNAAITAAGLVFSITGDITNAKVTLKTIDTGADASIVISSPSTAPETGTDISTLIGISGSATGSDSGVERLKDAIIRTASSVNYFGIIANKKMSDALLEETALTVQSLDKIMFVGSSLSADITGIFKDITDAGLTHTRCLYYSVSANNALDFTAGYASRGLSVNMSGSRTASTMHLKEITELVGDTGLTQTLLDSCYNNGVDCYADFGVAKLFTSGENKYFDVIYFELAFKVKLQIAGFNFLAQTTTKIPQTEEGMDGLKKVWRGICADFVTNGYIAPGTWTGSVYFGLPADHIRNIADQGYHIYTIPIADQTTNDRTLRIAPAGQIAVKSSGAIHSSDLVVYMEA